MGVFRLYRRVPLLLALVTALAALPAVAAVEPCAPSCEVVSHTTLGFLPAVTYASPGAFVHWITLDGFHTASENVLSAPPRTTPCMDVHFSNNNAPHGARFEIVEGALYASEDGTTLQPCSQAQALPDGGFALDYICFLHPNTMKAKIVVK